MNQDLAKQLQRNHDVKEQPTNPIGDYPLGDIYRLKEYSKNQRSYYKADVTVILTCADPAMPDLGYKVDTNRIFGIAGSTGPYKDYSYAIVEAYHASAPTFTFTHEIGHLLGADHEEGAKTNNISYAKAHGFEVFTPAYGKYRTVMHTGLDWGNSTRLLRLSNPEKYYLNVPTGVVKDRDNVRQVETGAVQVSDFYENYGLTVTLSGPTQGNPQTSYTWSANILGGDPPYLIQWRESLDGINWSSVIGTDHELTKYIPANASTYYLKVSVWSNDYQFSDDYITVFVDQAEPILSNNVYNDSESQVNDQIERVSTMSIGLMSSQDLSIFPNPIDESAEINFHVKQDGRVRIEITSLTGRMIAKIIDTDLIPGSYNYSFNPDGLIPGLYFCNLYVNSQRIVKMFVIK